MGKGLSGLTLINRIFVKVKILIEKCGIKVVNCLKFCHI